MASDERVFNLDFEPRPCLAGGFESEVGEASALAERCQAVQVACTEVGHAALDSLEHDLAFRIDVVDNVPKLMQHDGSDELFTVRLLQDLPELFAGEGHRAGYEDTCPSGAVTG